jgi:hypothetical protein
MQEERDKEEEETREGVQVIERNLPSSHVRL